MLILLMQSTKLKIELGRNECLLTNYTSNSSFVDDYTSPLKIKELLVLLRLEFQVWCRHFQERTNYTKLHTNLLIIENKVTNLLLYPIHIRHMSGKIRRCVCVCV